MGNREKGKRAIPKLDEAIITSVCLFHFPPFPSFLITHLLHLAKLLRKEDNLTTQIE